MIRGMVIAASVAISLLPSISLAGSDSYVCEGQWATAKDCGDNSGGVWVQGIPLNAPDCGNTCEEHGGFAHTGCGTIDNYAAKICGSKTVVKTHAYGSTEGNQCGYNWWKISCQ